MMVVVVLCRAWCEIILAVTVRLESRLVIEWVGWVDGDGRAGVELRTESSNGLVGTGFSVVIIRCQSLSMRFGGWSLLRRRIPGGYLKCRLLV
jgi:hypothetical protein